MFLKVLEGRVVTQGRRVLPGIFSFSGMTVGEELTGTKALTFPSPSVDTDSLLRMIHKKPIVMGHEFFLPGKDGPCL